MLRNRVAALFAGLMFAMGPMVALADREAAQELIIQGRYDEAMQEINTLLAAQPDDAELRFLKGIVYAEQGEDDMAIEVFAGLTQDYPELPEPYNNLAVLFAQQGDYEKARESLLAAIQTHPSYSTAHENLGDLYAKMAGNAYNRALQENQSNESARLKLSKMNALFASPAPGTAVASTNQSAPAQSQAQTRPPAQTTPPVTSQPEPELEMTEPEPIRTEPEPAATAPGRVAQASEPVQQSASEAAAAAAMQAAANEIAGTVAGWASAWSAQDVDGYLSFYASDFRPNGGLSRAAWAAQRRDRVASPASIEVGISDLFVDVQGPESARAVFRQDYAATGYSDTVIKTLNMRREGGSWKITREVSRAP